MLTPIIYNLTILYRRSSRHVLVVLSAFASHLSINNPPPHSIPATASLCQRLESLLVSVTLKSMMTARFCHLQSHSGQCQLWLWALSRDPLRLSQSWGADWILDVENQIRILGSLNVIYREDKIRCVVWKYSASVGLMITKGTLELTRRRHSSSGLRVAFKHEEIRISKAYNRKLSEKETYLHEEHR